MVEGPGPGHRAHGRADGGKGPGPFANLLNEFVSQRSYFLLASLNYLMNLFLGGAISERICQSSITDHAENYFSEMSLFFEEVPYFMKT